MKEKLTNPEYTFFYKIYKLLPMIYAGLVLVGGLVFGILDAVMEITEIGQALEVAAVPIWLLIGAVASAISLWLTSIIVSPTIVRTDAIIQILKKMQPQHCCNADTTGEQPLSYQNTDISSEQPKAPPVTLANTTHTDTGKKDVIALLKNIVIAKKRLIIIILSIILLGAVTIFALDMIGVL